MSLERRLQVHPPIRQHLTRPTDAVTGAEPNTVTGVENHETWVEPCPIAWRPHDIDPTAGPGAGLLVEEPHEVRIGRVAGDDGVEANASACQGN